MNVYLEHLESRHRVTMSKTEWDQYSDTEKAAWKELPDPVVENKSLFERRTKSVDPSVAPMKGDDVKLKGK